MKLGAFLITSFSLFYGAIFAQSPLSNIKIVAAGGNHSLAIDNDGTLWGWGNNTIGELGTKEFKSAYSPRKIRMMDSVVMLAAGHAHSFALKNNGTVWAWGLNKNGQLGIGSNKNSFVPVIIPSLSGIVSIKTCGFFSLALKDDGTVWSWGLNDKGQLGNGSAGNTNVPIQVVNLTDIIQIEVSKWHAMALKKDGTVWVWGYNDCGQLAFKKVFVNSSNVPVKIESLTSITQIAAGSSHSLALKNDGTVWAWGTNKSHINSDDYCLHEPVQVQTIPKGIISIDAGGNYSVATDADGTIWCWFKLAGGYGGMHNGYMMTIEDSYHLPEQFTFKNPRFMDIGFSHFLIIDDDGLLWAKGDNHYGQIGVGNSDGRIDQPSLVMVPTK